MNVCLTHDLSYKLRAREFHSIFVTFKGRIYLFQASLVAQMVKYLPTVQETQVRSLSWKIPWRREWLPTPVFLPGESHGQRSLVGYGPWGCRVGQGLSNYHFHLLIITRVPLQIQISVISNYDSKSYNHVAFSALFPYLQNRKSLQGLDE